jgi:hypothetical protein
VIGERPLLLVGENADDEALTRRATCHVYVESAHTLRLPAPQE